MNIANQNTIDMALKQYDIFLPPKKEHKIIEELSLLDIENISPKEAMDLLFHWKKMC
jgi:hypothetical protein